MYLNIEPIMGELRKVYQSGDLTLFLRMTTATFRKFAQHDGLKGQKFFVPQCDALMEEIAAEIAIPHREEPDQHIILHVATEVYDIGGHTRVMEDIVRALPEKRHVLILTDSLRHYAEGLILLAPQKERLEALGISVMLLPDLELSKRARSLTETINQIAPGTIFVNLHAFDAAGYAAISGKSAPRVLLLHHADHYPALGSYRHDYQHVDLSEASNQICCKTDLQSPALLPMMVVDHGKVELDWSKPLTGAVSGSAGKFAGNIGGTYASLVSALLSSGVETLHHVGAIFPAMLGEIQAELDRSGIDRSRMIFHGDVPSLAGRLKEISPHFVLNSHPTGGGKAVLEAMSLGLPILYYSPPEKPLILNSGELGAAATFASLAETPAAVEKLRLVGADTGRANRQHYEQHHTPARFKEKLETLIFR